MSFVDLAGSERAAAVSKNVAARLREGTKINLSLMALGKVVDALANNWVRTLCYLSVALPTHLCLPRCNTGS